MIAMNPEQTPRLKGSGSTSQGTFINNLPEPENAQPTHEGHELERLYGARIQDYCNQLVRDPARGRAVCAQVLVDAVGVNAPGTHRFDWLRRIADRRCQQAIEVQVFALLDRGERRAAETELYDAYGVRILGFCRQLLRDPRAAEDVAQQAVLEACRDLHQCRRNGSLYPWLRRIARNRCVDAIRKRQVEARFTSDEDVETGYTDSSSPADEILDRRRMHAELLECLRRLSPKNRHTVIVRFLDDEASYAELALLLGENGSTLNRRVNRSMKDLRECLETKGHR
jgi:RNA polymerase sigma factor (sigma-70 family)